MVVRGGDIVFTGVLGFIHVFNGFKRETRDSSSILNSLRGIWLLIGCLIYVGLVVLLPRSLMRLEVCLILLFRIFLLLML